MTTTPSGPCLTIESPSEGLEEELADLVDSVMGVKFRTHGRSRDGFSCLGFYLWLIEEVRGERIEDPYAIGSAEVLRNFWALWEEVDPPYRLLDGIYRRGAGCQAGDAHVEVIVSTEPDVACAGADVPTGVHRMGLRRALQGDTRVYRLQEP